MSRQRRRNCAEERSTPWRRSWYRRCEAHRVEGSQGWGGCVLRAEGPQLCHCSTADSDPPAGQGRKSLPSDRLFLLTDRTGRASAGKESACNARDTADVGLIPGWRSSLEGRKWQPTPVFLPEKSRGLRSLTGYSPKVHKESDTTEQLSTASTMCIH